MTVIEMGSLMIVLAAAFGAINYLFLRLPQAIGILIVALAASVTMMVIDRLFPAWGLADTATSYVREIEFANALLEGMLGLLLFAGALHVKVEDLRENGRIVFLMATLGVGLSTIIVGSAFSWLTGMPFLIAMVFGALISPTDPVAVLGVLKQTELPKSLETQIAGESLFNDGVGYVVFLVLAGIAYGGTSAGHGAEAGGDQSMLLQAGRLFFQEAVGGAVLGLALGWLVFRVMRRIDDYPLEVLITLALAAGGYVLAQVLHVSAPITAVCSGIVIGDIGARYGMSEETRRYVDAFWQLIDEILNSVLFLLIGFEVFAIVFSLDLLKAGAMAIALSLGARLISVWVPVTLLRRKTVFARGAVPVMTWGGLKGGISVALALSLPQNEWTPTILTATYMVVVFTIIVQGLTVAQLARRVSHEPEMELD